MSRLVLSRLVVAAALAVSALSIGCGSEIGDSCSTSSDCSPDGDRICDVSSLDGYCTIQGCDYDSCPGEATCVRFFTGTFDNRVCDPLAEDVSQDKCGPDEVCTIAGTCAPRTNEVRYCMKTCSSRSDCRDGYECRDQSLMQLHGGEPVLEPGASGTGPKFCAQAP